MKKLILAVIIALSYPLAAFAGNNIGEQPGYVREQGLDQLFFYVAAGDGAGATEYICTAGANSLSSEAKWQIRKFSYDSSDRISSIRWADGTDNFTKICDDRASYDYEP